MCKGIGSKREIELVVPYSHNHKVLGKLIISYSRSNFIPCTRWGMTKMGSTMDAPMCPQWVMGTFHLNFRKKLSYDSYILSCRATESILNC